MRVPLFNLFEAGRYSLAPTFYPRLRSLRSLSPGLLRIKPRRGYTLTEKITHVAAGWGYPPLPTAVRLPYYPFVAATMGINSE